MIAKKSLIKNVVENSPIGVDTVINVSASVSIPYAVFEYATRISSFNGGAAISHALKGIGVGGVKGGLATLLLGAGAVYVGMQMTQSFIGEKVLEADYAKGEKTKEEIIEHVNSLPISNMLKGSLIKKVIKLS